jgi:2,4-dienoyl-CoA reductase-like NADH-dependent reductase (Old Yellow Enzyme family)
MARLFDPLRLRSLKLSHRIMDWHLVHYGRMAMGGAAMVMLESTAVEPTGRIGYSCLGIWNDDQLASLRRIARFIKAQGCVPAIQINHTGRKGSWRRPWHGYAPLDQEDVDLRSEPPWSVQGPSPLPVSNGKPPPLEMTAAAIQDNIASWVQAARNADLAEFDALEIHAAHGYLVHQFLSPISNHRNDAYGGSNTGRMRFPLELVEAVRAAWPAEKPLLVRVSAVDGVDGGLTIEDTIAFSRELAKLGVDLVDCSSGGIGGLATVSRIPRGPGFQVPFAQAVRREAGIRTIAVGLITQAMQAAEIIENDRADLVAVGREILVTPNWPNVVRTQLEEKSGFGHWPRESGWWLDRRVESISASTE